MTTKKQQTNNDNGHQQKPKHGQQLVNEKTKPGQQTNKLKQPTHIQ